MIQVNENDFEEQVLQAEGLVLVDFYAEWCGPCRMMTPVLEELSTAGHKVVKVDCDQSKELARRYGVNSIPHFVLFENGKPKTVKVGMQTKQQLESLF